MKKNKKNINGYILAGGNETNNVALLIPQGCNRFYFVENIAILFTIGNFSMKYLTIENSIPKCLIEETIMNT